MRHILTALMAALVIVVTSLGTTSCSSCDHNENEHLTYALDSLLTPFFPSDAPGAIVIVSDHDSIIYERYFGMADLEDGTPMRPDTRMCLASSTKTFTATAVLKLHEQDRLSLDDPLLNFFPQLPAEVFGGVTLRHMLSQSSGIPDGRPRTTDEWRNYRQNNKSVFGDGSDFRIYGRDIEFTTYLMHVDSLDFIPGTRFERQDPPYMLFRRVIEQASGHEFESHMESEIFRPAGITTARYIQLTGVVPDMAHGYRRTQKETKPNVFVSDDGRWEEYDYGEADFFLSRADRGLFMTARDLAHWQHVYNSGLLLSEESTRLFGIPLVNTGRDGEGYSLGVNVTTLPDGTVKYYHGSTRGGFVTVETLFPEHDLAYIIMANRCEWPYMDVAKQIDNLLMREGLLDSD